MRWAVCLLVLWGIATGTRHIARLPHVFGAVAQETLVIYVAHLCLVYGSVWNQGLVQTRSFRWEAQVNATWGNPSTPLEQ